MFQSAFFLGSGLAVCQADVLQLYVSYDWGKGLLLVLMSSSGGNLS